MSIKRFAALYLFLLLPAAPLFAYDKSYQDEWIKKLDEVTQNFLLLYDVGSISRRDKLDFPKFKETEIDAFLKSNLQQTYPGFHPDIAHYVQVIANRPKYQLQLWYAIVKQTKKQIPFDRLNKVSTTLIFSRLAFPHLLFDDAWLLPNIISLNYGNTQDNFLDQRLQVVRNYQFQTAHYEELIKRKNTPIQALSMSVLGSTTLTRIPDYAKKSYWELYPELKHTDRDFYAVFLATAFILAELEKLDVTAKPFPAFTIEDKNRFADIKSSFTLHLDYLAKHFEINKDALKLINRVFYAKVIPSNTSFKLPSSLHPRLQEKEEDIALGSAYFMHKIKAPFCLVKYKVKTTDSLSHIASNFSSTIQDIVKFNHLSHEQVLSGQMLFIKVHQMDSIFYSKFSTLNNNEIAELLKSKVTPLTPTQASAPVSSPQKVHVVKSGETLSHISRKYNVSVKQIKDWNNLKSDNLQIGQKLIIKK